MTLEQARPFEDLARQRNKGGVIARDEGKATAGMEAGDPRQKMEVVIDDGFGDGRAGDVNYSCSRQPEKKQKAQHSLLVVMGAGHFGEHLLIEAQARNDEDRSRPAGIAEYLAVRLGELLFKIAESRKLVWGRGRIDIGNKGSKVGC